MNAGKGDTSGSSSYFGGKGGAGTYQTIINLIPPHRTYIETHLGGGAIMKRKKPAPLLNIGIDIDPDVIKDFSFPGVDAINDDAARFLKNYTFCGDEFVYSDPPYPVETRKSATRYGFEYTTEQHVELLEILKSLPCMVMVSSYYSSLYAESLSGWNCHSFESQTRRGKAVEWLWYNYGKPSELHDYRYLGNNFRDRERIKRKRKRWINRIAKMPTLERNAMFAGLPESVKETIRSTVARENDLIRIPSTEVPLRSPSLEVKSGAGVAKDREMNNFIYKEAISLEQLKEIAKRYHRLVYGAGSGWWKIGSPIYKYENGLPCGPRGEVLLQTDDPVGFIEEAEKNPEYYGKHGLKAFVAAYHGNVRTADHKPTSFETWDEYNKIIDNN